MRVVFFAKLREALDCAELDYQGPATNVAELRAELMNRGPVWAEALAADNILCAVNQSLARSDQGLSAGDEVAFYPPVTGG